MPMLTMVLLLHSSSDAHALECATNRFMHAIRAADPVPTAIPPPVAGKAQREAHGVCAGSIETENFVLKWGGDDVPDAGSLEEIAASLEVSWRHHFGEMGHSMPYGTETHLFNVYVGDSGDCAPSALGAGGYYTVDPDGWPMIVLSQQVFGDPLRGRSTAAHELYHAVQHAEEAYLTNPAAQWWWEATASWVEGEVYPGNAGYFTFLFGYAFEPHRQLNSYLYPSEGRLEEYHQYGAAIWPRYLTEFVTDWVTIRDSWSMADAADDPINVVAELLGEPLDEHFADFAAHNATWDYADGDAMEELLDRVALLDQFPGRDKRIAATHDGKGTGTDWAQPPEALLPQRYGYNVIRLAQPDRGTVTARFLGDSAGSGGSASRWSVRVVRVVAGQVEYTAVPLVDGGGETTIAVDGTEPAVYLVVSVTSPQWDTRETFDYEYQLEVSTDESGSGGLGAIDMDSIPSAIETKMPPAGCQCSTSTSRPWGWALLVPLMALVRRHSR